MISYTYSPDLHCVVAFDGKRCARLSMKSARNALAALKGVAGEYAQRARLQLAEALRTDV